MTNREIDRRLAAAERAIVAAPPELKRALVSAVLLAYDIRGRLERVEAELARAEAELARRLRIRR